VTTAFTRIIEGIDRESGAPLRLEGRVCAVVGETFEIVGLPACIGSIVDIARGDGPPALGEVVGFRSDACIAMPLTSAEGVASGAAARLVSGARGTPQPARCVGRIVDGMARPLDGGPPLPLRDAAAGADKPPVLERALIDRPLDVGIRAINGLHTIGRGARLGVFAGSGVGKSTLLGQIARFGEVDAIVVALVGERRREVREFVERDLGDALERSTVVVATGDEPAVLRRRAGLLAAGIATELASEGRDVLFLMDSLSRFCAAQREIGLAAGEPPATRGYPPSVWSLLPQLVERAGTTSGSGSVTGIYTVLVEGDDLEEPVADAARSLLDGHLVLSRRVAEAGRFPPIDPLASLSRVMDGIVSEEHAALARAARSTLSVLAESEELIRIGASVQGADPRLDAAIRLEPGLRAFLAQARDERAGLADAVEALGKLLGGAPR